MRVRLTHNTQKDETESKHSNLWSESKCLLLSRFLFGLVDSNPTPQVMPWNRRVDCFLDQLPFLNLATFILHPSHVSYFKRNHLVSEDCITLALLNLKMTHAGPPQPFLQCLFVYIYLYLVHVTLSKII